MSRWSWILWKLRPALWPRPVRRGAAFLLFMLLGLCALAYAQHGLSPWQTLYEYFGRNQYFTLTMVVLLGLGTAGFVTSNNSFHVAALAYGVAYGAVVLGGTILCELDDVSTIAASFHGIAIILLIIAGVIGMAVRRRRQQTDTGK